MKEERCCGIKKAYEKRPIWEAYDEQILVDYRQALEEGKDVAPYAQLCQAVDNMPSGVEKERMADSVFFLLYNAPQRKNFAYTEPSELDGIKQLRNTEKFNIHPAPVAKEKIYGAWMGRICGCMLGKTVEGIRSDELFRLLKASGNYPMHRYIHSQDVTETLLKELQFDLRKRCYADQIACAPSDDDTNYTVLSAVLLDRCGRDFTAEDVAELWLAKQPRNAYCTAERVAFCNFIKGYYPPISAVYKNPYREWIGAQIRGDYFGYINPGNPEAAAEMAWRDASISHVKNGIYGEMFVAAMLAAAAVCSDIETILLAGLSQIPQTSRLYQAIRSLMAAYHNGISQDGAFAEIHRQFDEHNGHDWCHTISNALIVAAALIYGSGDFGKSICMAVQAGFDTDCNGATVGSILGMRGGISSIDEVWTAPFHGELNTDILGVGRVKIMDMVEKTFSHMNI